MPQSEKPCSEPEIIPPGRGDRGATSRQRVYVSRVGPLGVFLAILLTGILAAVMLVLLFATFLIWVPVVIFFIVGAITTGFLRAYSRWAPP